MEQRKKKIVKIFKDFGSSIMITSNITSADLLYITKNLKNESHQAFKKPSNGPKYIDIDFNQPPQMLKQPPKSSSKILSKKSLSKEVSDKTNALRNILKQQ